MIYKNLEFLLIVKYDIWMIKLRIKEMIKFILFLVFEDILINCVNKFNYDSINFEFVISNIFLYLLLVIFFYIYFKLDNGVFCYF